MAALIFCPHREEKGESETVAFMLLVAFTPLWDPLCSRIGCLILQFTESSGRMWKWEPVSLGGQVGNPKWEHSKLCSHTHSPGRKEIKAATSLCACFCQVHCLHKWEEVKVAEIQCIKGPFTKYVNLTQTFSQMNTGPTRQNKQGWIGALNCGSHFTPAGSKPFLKCHCFSQI